MLTGRWWLSSFARHHGPYYLIGPLHVPVLLEWVVGLGVVTAACVGPSTSERREWNGSRYSVLTAAVLAVTGVLGATGGA